MNNMLIFYNNNNTSLFFLFVCSALRLILLSSEQLNCSFTAATITNYIFFRNRKTTFISFILINTFKINTLMRNAHIKF